MGTNQHLTRFHQLSSEEDLVQNRVHLVEVEDQVQLTYVAEVLVKDLHEEMDGLEVSKLVIFTVYANAEEETFKVM